MKKIIVVFTAMALVVSCATKAPSVDCVVTYRDGSAKTFARSLKPQGDHYSFCISRDSLANVASVEIVPEFGRAAAGTDAYFVNGEGLIMHAKEGRDNCPEYKSYESPLPIGIYKTPKQCWLGIINGLVFDTDNIFRLEDSEYSMSTLWELEQWKNQYEDLCIDFFPLGKKAGYNEAALKYRQMRVVDGGMVPIKERMKNNPELAYMVDAPVVRIRQGWKPYPPTIIEQTLENEPAMQVKITFDQVKGLIDSLKAAGVPKAQLCLVGWVVRGHDGRDPDTFPVEPSLGGEKKLKELIAYAKVNGYQIVGHSNRTDIYHISKHWNGGADALKKADGSLSPKWAPDCGGQMYDICMKESWEKYFQMYEPMTAALGFRGLEYIDVLSVIRPHECYDPAHPVNRKQAAEITLKMLEETQNLFGGSSSEGGYDYCCDKLDMALYVSMDLTRNEKWEIVDDHLPIWQMVFNGYVLGGIGSAAVNYTIKEPAMRARVVEYGGHPMMYINSIYRPKGSNWMGENDLEFDSPAAVSRSVAEIRKSWDYMKELGYLQLETLDKHEILPDGIHKRSTFSDGTVITVNYEDGSYIVEKK